MAEMKIYKLTYLLLIMLVWISTACKATGDELPKSSASRECATLPIGYPVQATMPDEEIVPIQTPYVQPAILPLANWNPITDFPAPASTDGVRIDLESSENKIWVVLSSQQVLLSYDTKNSKWKSYTTIGDYNGYPAHLFVSRDNTLWGYDVLPTDSETHYISPELIRYDGITDQFEIIRDKDGLFEQLLTISSVAEGPNGILWILALKKSGEKWESGLYSFDPVSLHARRHLVSSLPSAYANLVLAPDGSVWFEDLVNKHLTQYIPETGEIRPYLGYPSYDNIKKVGGFSSLFFDNAGRLWMGNYGWLDFTNPDQPIWYQIIDSPAFLTNNTPPYYTGYTFAPASEIYQSSDGFYWFTSQAGIVQLGLEQQSWCLITTGVSRVVEDNQKNLWIAVYGKLYKNALGK